MGEYLFWLMIPEGPHELWPHKKGTVKGTLFSGIGSQGGYSHII